MKTVFPPPEVADGEQSLVADLVRTACLFLLVPISLILVQALLFQAQGGRLIFFALGMGLTAALVILVLRAGQPRGAGALLLAALLGLTLYGAYTGGGVRSDAYAGLSMVVFFSAWIVGLRGALVIFAVCVMAGLALLQAEAQGLLPATTFYASSDFYWYSIITQMLLALLLQWRLLLVVEQAQAARLRSEERFRVTLEERVAERTAALTAANDQLQAAIATRDQTKQALQASEQQYGALLENMQQGVMIMQDERVVFCNQALARMSGYAAAELLALPPAQIWTIIHDEDREWLMADLAASFKRGAFFDENPFRIYHADRSIRWISSFSNVISYQGRPALLALMSDVTASKEVEAALHRSRNDLRAANVELARASKLKDEFLANMSHELRTPLNAILGPAELLSEGYYGPLTERQLRSITSIIDSGRHLLELINDILDLGKIEASKLVLSQEAVVVRDLCQASLHVVDAVARNKGIIIQVDLDPQAHWLMGDPRRLKQILVNLLTNAVKFTPAGGQVGLEVRGDPEARLLRFSVRDTGIGIAADDLPRLFRPFEQLDSSLSRHYEGTGLGLSLVARLTQLHGGTVAVQSELGQGSRFTVTLPWQPGPIDA